MRRSSFFDASVPRQNPFPTNRLPALRDILDVGSVQEGSEDSAPSLTSTSRSCGSSAGSNNRLASREKVSIRNKWSLDAPLPNLFRATFEQAQRHAPGEQWLQQRIDEFDAGGKHKRKEVLQEFVEYIKRSAASSMEELFSNNAHLFFIRLTSWFSVTLPMFYELPLQLKVFLTFLEFREQAFVRAFFESGAIIPLMHTLSVDFDVPDEVRCLAIMVLHKLAANGRQHKEVLCQYDLIANISDCVSDGLRWETLKYAGRLLCELFHSNPRYQAQVLDALQDIMAQRLPLTQRVGTQAFISLLAGEGRAVPPLLCDPARHQSLVQRALLLLESYDLRVGADAYCLLCRLMRNFGCDELLFDFARTQLRFEKNNAAEWLQLESGIYDRAKEGEVAESIIHMGERNQNALNRLHVRVAEALASPGALPLEEGLSGRELIQRVNRSNAEFCGAFRAEAGHILRWGLLIYLAKRNPKLCAELLDGGLTEMLLMYLLDVAHPVRQAAALTELHRLRVLSPKAKLMSEVVLVKAPMLDALSLDQFMQVASPDDMAQARYRLRNLRKDGLSHVCSADEHLLQQHMVEKKMADQLGIHPPNFTSLFLTQGDVSGGEPPAKTEPAGPPGPWDVSGGEPPAKTEPAEPPAKPRSDDAAVPRSGSDIYSVQRVPLPAGSVGGSGGGSTVRYRVDRGPVEEVPFCGSLASFLTDPLDVVADEESPLIQEMKDIESFVRLGSSCHAKARAASTRRTREGPRKASHRPSPAHARALAMRSVPPPGVEVRLRPRPHPGVALSPAASQATELSVCCAHFDELFPHPEATEPRQRPRKARSHTHSLMCGCKPGKPGGSVTNLHNMSTAETSVGQDQMLEFSRGEPSFEFHSTSLRDTLATGPSQTLSTSSFDVSLEQHPSRGSRPRISVDSMPKVVERSTVMSVIEVHKPSHANVHDSESAPSVQKRIYQVAPAPYHDCIAFDKTSVEEERQRNAGDVAELLRPSVRRLMHDLRGAGAFPRRRLVRGSVAHGPEVGAKRGYGHQAPRSAREPQSRGCSDGRSEGAASIAVPPGATWSLPPPDSKGSSFGGERGIRSDVVLPLDLPQLRVRSASTKENMKDFFPASAR